jgi:uncharacterized protein involved in exopolysaccharide biosynthesis
VERPDTQNTNHWDWLDGLDSIWRARYLVAAATLLAGMLTAAVMLVAPRSYLAVVTLRVGKVMDHLLVDPTHVASEINSESIGVRLRNAAITGRTPEDLGNAVSARVGAQIPGPTTLASPFVAVEARGRTGEEAKRLSMAVAQIVIDEHRPRYDTAMKRVGEYREQLQSQVVAIRGEIAEIESAVRTFRTSPTVGPPAVLLMRAQLEEKETQLLAFLREQRDLDINVTVNSEMTRVLAEPSVLAARTRPRRTMTTVAGAATGGVLAVFWALALDARRRRRSAAAASEPR